MMQQQIVDLKAEIEAQRAEFQAQLQSYTYSISHDLRAPLRHIVSYAKLVSVEASSLLDAEQLGFLEIIVNSAERMSQMIDGLAELSRLAGLALRMEPVDLGLLVSSISAELSRANEGRVIHWNIARDLPHVQGDLMLLTQVLRNVLGNAALFTKKRKVAEIAISATLDASGTKLVVSDNGVGFDPLLKSQIFKPFARLHPNHEYEGIGLGLVFAHKALQRLNASVDIDAKPDEGCCVTIFFRSI